jgi:hypothetical protein
VGIPGQGTTTHTFRGSLQSIGGTEPPIHVSIQFDGPRVRMWSDRHRMGSWDVDEVRVERVTIFRFAVHIDGESYAFTPDDPAGFTSIADVEIDLTRTEKPRFGLADRLKQVGEAG